MRVNLDLEQKRKLDLYLELLLKWNQKVNLVGYKTKKDILTYLIQDSFYLFTFLKDKLVSDKEQVFLDLGSGAGLPGIPFRLIWDKGLYYLVEIRKKRISFLKNVVFQLKLNNTFVLDRPAESLPLAYLSVDFIVTRAFKPYLEVLKIAFPLACPRTRLIILTNLSSPPTLPGEWKLEDVFAYTIGSKKRYFWSLVPVFLNSCPS
ncbi:MAG: 16S rRNA (guanine(527)-N(7))-methyltransferase RsmG [Desulfonauticus sp.]|nr:16S rRNA (guanine(527)-N(7))-methyltransferase RsmG [Desulfonauticus sp.]